MHHPTPLQAPLFNPDPTSPGIAGRLGAVLRALNLLIGFVFLKTRYRGLIDTLFWRLQRTRQRLERIAADRAAGKPPRQPRPSRPGRSGPSPIALPRQFGWLLKELAHHGAAWHHRLAAILDEPEAAAFLADNPSAARLVRPICHMLGLRHPNVPPPPRRPRKIIAPSAPAAPPSHPGGRATASNTPSPPALAVSPPDFAKKPA